MPRTSVLARKVGMTRIYNDAGEAQAVTVLDLSTCQVLAVAPGAESGSTAIVTLGIGTIKPANVTKPVAGQFRKFGAEPKRLVRMFHADAQPPVGAAVTATFFAPGQYVDVAGTSKGKGFAGVMKRHNFGGLRATHGVSVSHRSHGSTGQRQDPGKVFKGKKMAGHLGDERVTTQNIRVAHIDAERNLVFLSGSVPGANGGYVEIRDAVKKKQTVPAATEGFHVPTSAAEA